MSERYKKSEELLARAFKSIPLGTQTFSKSKTQYPYGVSPYFIERGSGSHVWDVDGNEYIDFVNSLAAISLGYNDPDVNTAVQDQLEKGIIFSLSHSLEVQVAEKLIEMIPCAEMVRYGKNGSDATAGAIRLARAYTGKDHVVVCGYHGWQDWYIGSTPRNMGVPEATSGLTHSFLYNDLESLKTVFAKYPEQIAAVILEPMNLLEPEEGFLEGVKEITHHNGAVLIFDETVTGFRFANGGAQEYFGVIPDLATFGKGIANGYPISAVVGKAEIMQLMEEIFFSFTFGGEALSLAAALATMKKLQQKPVIKTMWSQGEKLVQDLQELLDHHGMGDIIKLSGFPVWSFLIFNDSEKYSAWDIKTLFLQEMFKRGILILATHNMSYSHSDEDIKKLLTAYNEVLPMIRNSIDSNSLEQCLQCEPLRPLFKIR